MAYKLIIQISFQKLLLISNMVVVHRKQVISLQQVHYSLQVISIP